MNCPTCGAAVEVYTADEGTSSYVPLAERRVAELEEALRKKEDRVLKGVLWLIDCERDAAQTTGGKLDAIENIERRVRGHFVVSGEPPE
jgi:transcription initiation factor IIE alpha subunit